MLDIIKTSSSSNVTGKKNQLIIDTSDKTVYFDVNETTRVSFKPESTDIPDSLRYNVEVGIVKPTSDATYTNAAGPVLQSQLETQFNDLALIARGIAEFPLDLYMTDTIYADIYDRVTNSYTYKYINLKSNNYIKIPLNHSANDTDEFDIIGLKHENLTDINSYGFPVASGKAGITFQMANLYVPSKLLVGGQYKWADLSNSWQTWGSDDAYIRTDVMAEMYNLLPDYIKKHVKDVSLYIWENKDNSETDSAGLSPISPNNKCFLLSKNNLTGNTTNPDPIYRHYYNGASIKKELAYIDDKELGTVNNGYWTRSSYSSNTRSAYRVNAIGNVVKTLKSTDTIEISFAFCI